MMNGNKKAKRDSLKNRVLESGKEATRFTAYFMMFLAVNYFPSCHVSDFDTRSL